MTTFDRFDRDLAAFIEADTSLRAPAGLHATAMDRARTTRQRPGWLVAVRGGTIGAPLADVRPALYAAVALALLALLAGLVIVGAPRREPLPSVRTNGAIAYHRGAEPGPFRLFISCPGKAEQELIVPVASSIGWPSWSPDGTRIAFNGSSDPAATGTDGRWDVYTMARDGTDVSKLTNATRLLGDPSWSPDGRWITYDSTEPGTAGIWVMDAATGGGKRRVVATPEGSTDYAPRFSPDGTRLLFMRYTSSTSSALYVVDVDGPGEPFRITPPSIAPNKGAWSPDGNLILFDLQDYLAADAGIWTVRPEGNELLKLGLPATGGTFLDGYSDPVWSPDGSLILLVHWLHRDGTVDRAGLATVRADSADLQWVGNASSDARLPDWGTAPC